MMKSNTLGEAADTRPAKVSLSGVPETMLWPLWNRAAETKRADALVDDPWAVDLVERIDYDFRASFGKPTVFHPIRSRYCDDLLRAHVGRHGERATVVALGEGLDAQRLRAGEGVARWYSVDLPESIETRARLVPGTDEERLVARSAVDHGWMDEVDALSPPFITALGLLMYFEPDEVSALLRTSADRFPGAELVFDAIPPFFSRRTIKGADVTKSYRMPPCPWGISVDDLPGFLTSLGWEPTQVQTYADPFPERLRFYSFLGKIRTVRSRFAGSLVHATDLTP